MCSYWERLAFYFAEDAEIPTLPQWTTCYDRHELSLGVTQPSGVPSKKGGAAWIYLVLGPLSVRVRFAAEAAATC
jgi:hypothetical protein